MKLLKRLGLASLVSFVIATSAIVLAGLNDRVGNADMIVVPGNTVAANGEPSPRLRARLAIALKQFREQRAPIIFVSGGVGKEGFDEALSMSNYLEKNGVPANAIVKDSLGIDTAATARNAAAYLRAHGLKTAIAATQYFHVPRLRLALERSGVLVTGSVHADHTEMRDLYSIPRETIGYAAYLAKTSPLPP
jgi:vancomycin permeability regulator SanA